MTRTTTARHAPALAAAVLLAVWSIACGSEAPEGGSGAGGAGGPGGGPGAAPAVTVARPETREIIDWDEFTGRLRAVDSVEVRARVSGYLRSVHFEEGAQVNQRDLLFVIDPRPYEAVMTENKAQVTRAEVRLELARKDLDRAERLIELRAISEEEHDARIQEKREAEAALEAAEAAVEAAQLDVEFTRVRAPISGRIGRAMVTEGNLIRGGSADSTLLTTIVSLEPIYFYFTADEQEVLRYMRLTQAGQRRSSREYATPIELQLGDEEGFPRRGTIDFIDNRIDESTGTLQVRAVFENPDGLLLPGMFAKARVQARGPYEALLVPEEAVGLDQARQFVYVVDEGNVARRRPVELGPQLDGMRVIREGIEPGDRVVVAGLQRVRADSPVTPQTSQEASRSRTASEGDAP